MYKSNLVSGFSKCQFQWKIEKKNYEKEFEECTNQIYFMLLPPRQRKLGKMLSCWSHFSTRYTSWHAFSPEQHHSTTLFYLVVLLLVKTKSDIMRLYQRSFLTQFQCSGRYYLQTCLLSWIGWGNLVFFSPFGTEIRMPFVCVNHVLYAWWFWNPAHMKQSVAWIRWLENV